jgi:uncharacterized C2H2 Zn-finger protein
VATKAKQQYRINKNLYILQESMKRLSSSSSSSQSYKCDICGMVLVNYKEFLKHKVTVHIDKMFQCQSCNKVFGTKIKLEKHAAKVHGSLQYTTTATTANYNNSNNNGTIEQLVADKSDYNTEYMLLERAAEEEKARKRTRDAGDIVTMIIIEDRCM